MLQDDSEKDIDITKKQIGSEFKSFIKTNSNDYSIKLKAELMKGYKTYFDQLNSKIAEEAHQQETQQKELMEKIDKTENKIEKQMTIVAKRKKIFLQEKIFKSDIYFKIKAFHFFKLAAQTRIKMREKKVLIRKILLEKKKNKIFKAFKVQTLLEKTAKYDERHKQQVDAEIDKLQFSFKNQREEMLSLIAKGQEKLKHENRKKIQVKLMLDQMVLRGISAINLQAMSLSHNSLREVVKCDYNKEIDTKYQTMLFPETKTKAISKLK